MRLSSEASIGKPCPTCKRPITKAIQQEARKGLQDRARKNVAKRKLNPDDNQGRKKMRDDDKIKALAEKGHNASEIAKLLGISRRTVGRA